MTTTPLFHFSGVRGGYDGSIVVRGIDGEVDRGEVLCVLGRNGVGKSTLLKLLYGYLPGSGDVVFDGSPIDGLDPTDRSRLGIGYAPQERIVFDDLSVAENLTLMRKDRRLDHFAPYFERFPRLRERLTQLAGTLSGGERKLLSFMRVLAEDKPLMLLDEPSEGCSVKTSSIWLRWSRSASNPAAALSWSSRISSWWLRSPTESPSSTRAGRFSPDSPAKLRAVPSSSILASS